MEVDFKENGEQRNQHHAAAETRQGAEEAGNQRSGPDQESEFRNVHPLVCHS